MTWEAIPGYFDWQDTYREWVREAPKGGTIVEIGVFLGRSLAFLAREALDQGRHDLRLIGVDNFQIEEWMRVDLVAQLEPFGWNLRLAFETEMAKHAPAERKRVVIHGVPSVAFARVLDDRRERVSRVYIDGDHSAEAVAADIAAWLPLVEPGGIIGGHDFCSYGVEPAVRAAFGTDIEVRGSTWLHRVVKS